MWLGLGRVRARTGKGLRVFYGVKQGQESFQQGPEP